MEKSTAEKFQKENHSVWIMGIWTALPIEASIVSICEDDQKGTYAKVDYIPDTEYGNHAFRDVPLEGLYPSKEYMYKAMFEEMQAKTAEIKASIQTKDDCIRFMFQQMCTDWTARRAIQKIAWERWGMELE